MVIVAQPSAPVGVSAGIENCSNGTAVTYTSAFWMERPLHAETWNLTVTSCVDRVITVGETLWPSISSRAGSATSFTSSVPLPEVGQPSFVVGGGAGFAVTTAVGTDVACVEPSAFLAVTRERIVFPTSTPFSVYVLSVAPLMLEQLPPFESHRRHW